ncbi:hypothetical protein BS17DRAFT_821222 [Gyrodon lividus]|nr:hypothetical protein BS17DRAFT_821222 [Gyrodon lividus]
MQPRQSTYYQGAYMQEPLQYPALEVQYKDLEMQVASLKAEHDALNSLWALTAAKVDMLELPPIPHPEAAKPQDPEPAPQAQKETKKPKAAAHILIINLRNLCMQHWLKQVNNIGMKDKFDAYWWGTVSAAYDDEAKAFVTKKAWSDKAFCSSSTCPLPALLTLLTHFSARLPLLHTSSSPIPAH